MHKLLQSKKSVVYEYAFDKLVLYQKVLKHRML